MDLRLRMVLVGLVAGVIFAIVVAVQGCGHHERPARHGTHQRGQAPLVHAQPAPVTVAELYRR